MCVDNESGKINVYLTLKGEEFLLSFEEFAEFKKEILQTGRSIDNYFMFAGDKIKSANRVIFTKENMYISRNEELKDDNN